MRKTKHRAKDGVPEGSLLRVLRKDVLSLVLSFCGGEDLARLECTCKAFGRKSPCTPRPHAHSQGGGKSLAERAAEAALKRRGLEPSLWARATGASSKEQLHRATSPAGRLRRKPLPLDLDLDGPGSPSFGPSGELWLAEYHRTCVTRIGWTQRDQLGRGTPGIRVVQRHWLCAELPEGTTTSGVAVSADGLRLALTVQPHYALDGSGAHGILIVCAATGACLAKFLDGFDANEDEEDEMEYPSSIQWLQGGSHAGQLAIADYNKGRVQIRSAETGTLLRTVEVDENHCVSGVAELANDCLGVVPHSSDAVALVPPAAAESTRLITRLGAGVRWFGRDECGMPIQARGVDGGQTLAVSDGAHRCVLFFENAVAAATGTRHSPRRNSRTAPVSVAIDYVSGAVVPKNDRQRPCSRDPLWRRSRVEEEEAAAAQALNDGSDSDDGDFQPGDAQGGDDGEESDVDLSDLDPDPDSDAEDGWGTAALLLNPSSDEDIIIDDAEGAGQEDQATAAGGEDQSAQQAEPTEEEQEEQEQEEQEEEEQEEEESEDSSEDEEEDSDDSSDDSEDSDSDDEAGTSWGYWTSLGFDSRRGDMVVTDGAVWLS